MPSKKFGTNRNSSNAGVKRKRHGTPTLTKNGYKPAKKTTLANQKVAKAEEKTANKMSSKSSIYPEVLKALGLIVITEDNDEDAVQHMNAVSKAAAAVNNQNLDILVHQTCKVLSRKEKRELRKQDRKEKKRQRIKDIKKK